MNPNPKIAVTGLPRSNKTIMAMALSYITEIPFIQYKTLYEWLQFYGIALTGEKTAWKDMFLIAISSFVERRETEANHDCFISDGAVFSELAYLQSVVDRQNTHKIRCERENIMLGLEHVCMSYAAKHYDAVIHLSNEKDTQANRHYTQLYQKYGILYKQYQENSIAGTLTHVLADWDLVARSSVERSIYQAEKTLLTKKV